ncbi:MAG: spore coat protein CotJB [Christensenellales bacterium]
MNKRNALMRKIQEYDFVLVETALFLDTHPDDRQALAHYQKYLALKQDVVNQYTALYGPIRQEDVTSTTRWTWVDGAWPWENDKEV